MNVLPRSSPVRYKAGVGTNLITVKDAAETIQMASGSVRRINPTDQFLGNAFKVNVLPASERIMIQAAQMLTGSMQLELRDPDGNILAKKELYQGSTIGQFETTTLYDGEYLLILYAGEASKNFLYG